MVSDWRKISLFECTSELGDGLHGTPKYNPDGEYAFINGNNLCNGKIIIKSETKRVDVTEFEKYKKNLTDRTILVSINGTLGNIGIYNGEKVILGKSACYFNVLESFDKDFIKYVVMSPEFQTYMQISATGTTIKNISLKQMRDYTFYVPNLKTQQRISTILSAIDDKIELNNKINENLEQQAQAIFKSWFVDFEPFGGVMPAEWKEADIYSIANIIYGSPFASKLFNTEKNGKPIIRIRDLKDHHSDVYTPEKREDAYLIQPKDIVVGMDGEFRPYIWGGEQGWLNQRVCVFENKRPKGKAFLYFSIKPLLDVVEKTQVATTVIHIGKKDFDKFKIILPTDEILSKFDELSEPFLDKIVTNQLENQHLSALRDTLLPKLMNGEIDVCNVCV